MHEEVEDGNNNFWGLPIPTLEEYDVLFANRFWRENTEAISEDIMADTIVHTDPGFQEAISHDIDFCMNGGFLLDPTDDERDEFSLGLTSGYSFFVGVVTYIRMLRSNSPSPREFMSNARQKGDIPVIGERELDRIKLVRSGFAPVDRFERTDDVINDSSFLSLLHAQDYLEDAIRFESLMDIELDDIKNMLTSSYKATEDDNRIQAHLLGFRQGVNSAIELYIQAVEERALSLIEESLRSESP